jgi:hypothetical protein
MRAERMALVEDPADELRVALRPLADGEEGRESVVLREDVEHLWREDRVGAVVEREGHTALGRDRGVRRDSAQGRRSR